MRSFLLILLLFLTTENLQAQALADLPLTPFLPKVADTSKPMVVYVSGDGGLNTFSKALAQEFANNGLPVIFFNSLKYFWSKKTPAQTAADIDKVIAAYKTQWKRKNVVLIGYSFGADVSPFIFNRLNAESQHAVKQVVLLSPSNLTDFEIHVTQMFGRKQTEGISVADEINKITTRPVLILQAEREDDKIAASSLKIKNYAIVVLKGGHHYDHDEKEIADTILKNLKLSK